MSLEALEKSNTIFISAQPDEVFFHWQVELYLYQFAKHNIADRCYALFGYRDSPSTYVLELAKKYKHIILYKDERDIHVPNLYIPSIRPHLLKKFFTEHPELGASVFYHDSDIFLVKLPSFQLMLNDTHDYVSDTISYIGYNYINNSQKRYKEKYPAIAADDLATRMCDVAGISLNLIKKNERAAGGAQYLMKNIDAAYWEEVEVVCQKLYDCMKAYDKQYPIDHGIQIWTADMWAVIWLLWKRGHTSIVHPDLEFSWGISSVTDYFKRPIFHLAGVTLKNNTGKFYKSHYKSKNVFTEYAKDKKIFDFIDPTNATYEYVKVIKEYSDGHPIVEKSRFLLDSKDSWSSVYTKDKNTIKCKNPVWRSSNGAYIIFHNTGSWIITSTKYEGEVGANSGGFAATSAAEPYENGWNKPCVCKILDA